MNVPELITRARNKCGVEITLFDDDAMLDALNEGEEEFCAETKILDGTETLDIIAGQRDYAMRASATDVVAAWYQGCPLVGTTEAILNRIVGKWKTEEGPPAAFWIDGAGRTINMYPKPSEDAAQGLEIKQILKPTPMILDTNSTPSIPTRGHKYLVHWAAGQANLFMDDRTAADRQEKMFYMGIQATKMWIKKRNQPKRSIRIPPSYGPLRRYANLGANLEYYTIG